MTLHHRQSIPRSRRVCRSAAALHSGSFTLRRETFSHRCSAKLPPAPLTLSSPAPPCSAHKVQKPLGITCSGGNIHRVPGHTNQPPHAPGARGQAPKALCDSNSTAQTRGAVKGCTASTQHRGGAGVLLGLHAGEERNANCQLSSELARASLHGTAERHHYPLSSFTRGQTPVGSHCTVLPRPSVSPGGEGTRWPLDARMMCLCPVS